MLSGHVKNSILSIYKHLKNTAKLFCLKCVNIVFYSFNYDYKRATFPLENCSLI